MLSISRSKMLHSRENVGKTQKASFAKQKALCWIFSTSCVFIIFLMRVKVDNRTNVIQFDENPNTKWTILVTVNDGYFDFFQNWIYFYRKLHLNYKVVVIAEDETVFFKLHRLGNIITLVRSCRNTSSNAVEYASKAFGKLASGRPTYILKYLTNGLDIVYADLDTVWLRDPFPYFNGSFEVWMGSDLPGYFCTGLIAVKSSKETINLMQEWEESVGERLETNQKPFNDALKKSHVRLQALDSNRFPSGDIYFNKLNDEQRKQAVIVHNNFIIGHQAKLERFKTYKLWFS